MAEEKSFIGDLWDEAKGVIKQVSQIELERYEANRLAKIRNEEEAARTQNQLQLAGYTFTQPQQQAVVGIASVGAVLLLGTALILIARG